MGILDTQLFGVYWKPYLMWYRTTCITASLNRSPGFKRATYLGGVNVNKTGSSLIDTYLDRVDWRVSENSNMAYSLQGLNNYVSSSVTALYWLERVYPTEASKLHIDGDFHIHNLSVLGPYCIGWDLQTLLLEGFRGVPGKIESKPPRHLRTALGQLVNFFYTLSGEAAGAQAVSNFDTLMAGYIAYEKLSDREIDQSIQEFLFNINVPTRTGFQSPFSNCTMDLTVPGYMRHEPVCIGGKATSLTYGDIQDEIDRFNIIYCREMIKGDARNRIFTFPIVTYSITKDFIWDDGVSRAIFAVAGKYGAPYFSNFINSDLDPEDIRAMCCRLQLDKRELRKRGGGYFGSNPLTGSVGIVTINLPRIGYLAKDEDMYFERLGYLMDRARDVLETKRVFLEKLTQKGLFPYSKYYLRHIKQHYDQYWYNHFSTIGLIGMNEACINLINTSILTKEGLKLAIKTLTFMRDRLKEYQDSTGNMYNLEATPAEGTSYRLAKIDKEKYPDIEVANETEYHARGKAPFYTNSTHIPVHCDLPLSDVLAHQDKLQPLYTGGTVLHIFLAEPIPLPERVASMTRNICYGTRIPYFTYTPTFSICPVHGYIPGIAHVCPKCGKYCEVYSRVVGYYRPVRQWNIGKQAEFESRYLYKL
jgi:ribonucleoside-triphosphate reductase